MVTVLFVKVKLSKEIILDSHSLAVKKYPNCGFTSTLSLPLLHTKLKLRINPDKIDWQEMKFS
jgi:hypothetical protein